MTDKAIIIVGKNSNFYFIQKFLFQMELKWWATKDNNVEGFNEKYNAIIVREFIPNCGLEMALIDINDVHMEELNVEEKLLWENDGDKVKVEKWISKNE